MALNAGDVIVRLIADLKKFTPNLTKARSLLKGFSSSVGSTIRSAAAIVTRFATQTMRSFAASVSRYAKLAAIALAGVGIYATKLASEMRETQNRFNVIFGEMAGAAREWTTQFSDDLRQNRTDIENYLSTFQQMTTSMGFGPDASYDMSKSLVQLTTDISSFFDLSPEESFNKITSGLIGMPRPLQELGLDLRQTAVELEAVRIGLIRDGEEMTEQQKIIARLSQLVRVMGAAHGDAARTLNEAAPVFRTTWLQIKQALEAIGAGILPVAAQAARALREWLFANQALIAKWGEKLGATLQLAGDIFLQAVEIFRKSPQQGFDALLDALIDVMEAAGKIAVDMAIRIGKGIWQGVKEGVFGEDLPGLEERTRQIYEAKVRAYPGEREPYRGTGQTFAGFGAGIAPMPRFPAEYQEAKRAAATFIREEKAESVFEGLGDKWKSEFKNLGADIKASNEEMATGVEDAVTKWKASLDEIETKYKDELPNAADEAHEDVIQSTEQLTQTIAGLMQGMQQEQKETASKWADLWKQASDSINSSIEDAFVGITRNARDIEEILNNLAAAIQDTISRMIYQRYLANTIGNVLDYIMPNLTPSFGAKGGIVYAQRGILMPKGTDTVPAMLSPGEGVVPEDVMSWLRGMFGGGQAAQPEQTVNINVNAIDAQNTFRFFQKNKGAFATMMGLNQQTNHPGARSKR